MRLNPIRAHGKYGALNVMSPKKPIRRSGLRRANKYVRVNVSEEDKKGICEDKLRTEVRP